VTLRARWVTLRARWVTLRARWVTLRARWVTFNPQGFTEPDPRDDLSGMDVARKALICARMIGSTIEMSEVAARSLPSPGGTGNMGGCGLFHWSPHSMSMRERERERERERPHRLVIGIARV
jgi:hypothetical protein